MIDALVRPDLQAFAPYTCARDDTFKAEVLLNANESPWDDGAYNRYPTPQPQALVDTLADYYGVQTSQCLVSRGSDEAIDLLVRLFCQPAQDAVLITPPTFGMYETSAALQGARVVRAPLCRDNDFQLDAAGIAPYWDASIKVIFLCSPNNPTGGVIPNETISTICRAYQGKSIVVVDEAYAEFSECSAIGLLEDHDNLVVLRTLSKAFGLAGLRCGVALSSPRLIEWLCRIIAPYPVPGFVEPQVLEAFSTSQTRARQMKIATLKQERGRLFQALNALPCVGYVWPSEANFLLVASGQMDALLRATRKAKILLRDMRARPGLEDCCRISIGTPEQNTQLLNCLEGVSA
jgi:histidinol-phosphate aminotransferase